MCQIEDIKDMTFICAKDTNDNKITFSNDFQGIELQLPLLYGTFNTELDIMVFAAKFQ
jgi:hypothetical protein